MHQPSSRLHHPPRATTASLALLASALLLAACTSAPGEGDLRLEVSDGAADAEHARLFAQDAFPSAQQCRPCHEQHYREWSVSSHAYAQLSPVFNAMHATLVQQTNGTLGDFCIRCHTPVGMQLGEPVFAPHDVRAAVSNEGVTCIVCHSIDQEFGKVSARFPLANGDIFEPVAGPTGNEELKRVLDEPETYRNLVTEPGGPGRKVHRDVRPFFQMAEAGFCGRCHDVRLVDGFRLEDAFSEYKLAHASSEGTSCQDCHMGEVPGVPDSYSTGPAAVVGGEPTRPRRHTNHMITGPDYSVVHPALFPHEPELLEFATLESWLEFDVEAGWGTDAFEDEVTDEATFPERWAWPEDRYDARDRLAGQLELLEEGFERGRALLQRGYLLSEIEVERADEGGLAFSVDVSNGTDGHGAPTGFTAERLVFLRVEVVSPSGRVVHRSGDLDPNGDVRDEHSLYVHHGDLERDEELFSLQSKFILRNVRGGERESVLTPNHSLDPLPFVRPSPMATLAFGRPLGGRLHKRSLEPGGSREARYRVPASQLDEDGDYTVRVALVAAMVPVNLVDAIQHVGFDFGLSPREVARRIVAGHRVLWERETVVRIGADAAPDRTVEATAGE